MAEHQGPAMATRSQEPDDARQHNDQPPSFRAIPRCRLPSSIQLPAVTVTLTKELLPGPATSRAPPPWTPRTHTRRRRQQQRIARSPGWEYCVIFLRPLYITSSISSAGHALRQSPTTVHRQGRNTSGDLTQLDQHPEPLHHQSTIMEACNLESAMEAPHQHEPQTTQAGDSSSDDPNPSTVLTYLTFLEHKIGHLRGIVCSAPRQVVSAELSCIAVQLVSISNSLAGAKAAGEEEGASRSPLVTPPPPHELLGDDSESSDHDPHAEDDDDERPPPPPAGSYEVIELDREEILAPHVHSCKVCGKGFKRDANLRMHMRGHGEEYKTAAALAKPLPPPSSSSPSPSHAPRCFYSCPFVGCKRNREHRSFQPLKTAVCVKNHYRRSHCDKSYTCRRCNVKRFSVLADLRTHEKHCGRDRWVCSCGTSFSRKDKLFCHVAAFDGHAPALPPQEENAAADHSAPNAHGTDQQLMVGTEAVGRMASMECFPDTMFSGFALTDEQCLDDGRGSLSPMGLDSCDFDGFDLFGAPGIDF